MALCTYSRYYPSACPPLALSLLLYFRPSPSIRVTLLPARKGATAMLPDWLYPHTTCQETVLTYEVVEAKFAADPGMMQMLLFSP